MHEAKEKEDKMRTNRLAILLAVCLIAISGMHCGEGEVLQTETSVAAVNCLVDDIVYPVPDENFDQLYLGRGFYTDGNHLGRDMVMAEGAPIIAMACGVIRIYRPATGYGTLSVVIEHRLPRPVTVTSGDGRSIAITSFLSIYGHLRPTSLANGGTRLPWRVGDTVAAGQTIGYVQNGALNGDGGVHLHFGIRLQTMVEAQRVDPTAWFRGYDTQPSQRRYFADPNLFMTTLFEQPAMPMDAGVPTIDAGSPSVDAGSMSQLDASVPPPICVPRLEICGNGLDENCDGFDQPCPISPPMDAGTSSQSGTRYEFTVRPGFGWTPTEPFYLRDQFWTIQTCRNTQTTNLEHLSDGFYRCDMPTALTPFIGSFYDPTHVDWGDRGHIGTVGNSPARCTPTNGVDWRITDLSTGRRLYEGGSAGLPCASIGTQDRHRLP